MSIQLFSSKNSIKRKNKKSGVVKDRIRIVGHWLYAGMERQAGKKLSLGYRLNKVSYVVGATITLLLQVARQKKGFFTRSLTVRVQLTDAVVFARRSSLEHDHPTGMVKIQKHKVDDLITLIGIMAAILLTSYERNRLEPLGVEFQPCPKLCFWHLLHWGVM